MCVAAIAWAAHPRWALVAIANRDEYHARAAAPLSLWGNGILAGRDLEAGGTWLGVGHGRFALVTNRRAAGYPRPGMASRGALVTGWLLGEDSGDVAAMNPFNLFMAGPDGASLSTNFPSPETRTLIPGIHSLSNGGLDEHWHKEARFEAALRDWLDGGAALEALLEPLSDLAPDPAQPEEFITAPFVLSPVYGTRCSTVVAIDHDGHGRIIERRFDTGGAVTGETALEFS
ncbi:MAG: NRDE family protein [Novosphingobium sp.]|nr:NRDE family protein [Novosphingobium sp.]